MFYQAGGFSPWSNVNRGTNVQDALYDVESQLLYISYTYGKNIFYNVPLSAYRELSARGFSFYKNTIEVIYGTLLLTDSDYLPFAAENGMLIAAS